MKHMNTRLKPITVAVSTALVTLHMGAAYAQNAQKDALGLDEVVVTATSEARSKMKQSLSVSTLDSEQILATGATSSADILRSIPGIRSEASGGEGNANVTVRGVPVSAGGSRYVSFQEDGLPVLLLGDMTFVTPDMFIKTDMGTDGVEVVRGGSGSTLASNAPGGVINFISKTGEIEGGAVSYSTSLTKGLQQRVDFGYGTRLNERTTVQLSGFVRPSGEGPRDNDGVNTEKGGQLRVAIARDLGNGDSLKLFAKALNDQTPTYLPVPVRYEGSRIVQVNGVDPRTYSPYSKSNPTYTPGVNGYGGNYNVNDGLKVSSFSLGSELQLGLGSGWSINNKNRIAMNSGFFGGALPDNYGGSPAVKNAASNQASYVPIALATRFNDVGNAMNDLRTSKTWDVTTGKLTSSFGLFTARQSLNTDWGLYGYDAPVVAGSGATSAARSVYNRKVDLTFLTTAPYAALGYALGDLNLDASVRRDRQSINGSIAQEGEALSRVDATSSFTAYSLGANYSLNKDLAVFARVSEGASMTSDRFPGFSKNASDNPVVARACFPNCLSNVTLPPNKVLQYEVGTKYRTGGLSAFVTAFRAETKESNVDLTNAANTAANQYEANGVELETAYRMGNFRIAGGVTLTDSKIKKSDNAALVGKKPNRQADVIYQITPTYTLASTETTLGASIIGTTKSMDAQGSGAAPNGVELPAYTVVNAFVRQKLTKDVTAALSVNNIANTLAYTEANGDRSAARALTGRTVMATVRYDY